MSKDGTEASTSAIPNASPSETPSTGRSNVQSGECSRNEPKPSRSPLRSSAETLPRPVAIDASFGLGVTLNSQAAGFFDDASVR